MADMFKNGYTETTVNTEGYIEKYIATTEFDSRLDEMLADGQQMFTVKSTLEGQDGDLITKTVYTYEGNVVDADTGELVPDADRGKLNYHVKELRIKAFKHVFDMTDKEKRQNSNVLTMKSQGAAEVCYEFIDDNFYKALNTITNTQTYTVLNWDTVEDALGSLKVKSYANMFVLVSTEDYTVLKKSIRKELINTNMGSEITSMGYFMTVDGLTIVKSEKLIAGTFYIVRNDSVVYERKQNVNVSTDKYNEKELETFVFKFAGIVYVDSEKYAIKLTKQA